MNVTDLNNVAAGSMDKRRLIARLRSLATNVMQESRVAHGRADKPFTDDEAQRLDEIFHLLHLPATEDIIAEYEHYPLVSSQQSKPNPALDKIADLLAGDLDIPQEQPLTVTAQPVKKVVKG